MVGVFAIDPMHCVYLGVMRKQLISLISGPLSVRIHYAIVQRLNDNLTSISINIPAEFSRKPRSLNYVKRWKATEFRQFLLYTGPVVLENCLRKRVFYNFLALHAAIRIFASPTFHLSLNRIAHDYIILFLKECEQLYGAIHITQNFHLLSHLASCVQQFGPLEEFSAFPFENCLGIIKRKLRSGNKPLSQIVRRMAEEDAIGSTSTACITNFAHSNESFLFFNSHSSGPTTIEHGQQNSRQYKSVILKNAKITCKSPNNTIILKNGTVVSASNFIKAYNGSAWVLGYAFQEKTDLYDYPLKSSILNIHKVQTLSGDLKSWNLEDIECKAVCLKIPSEDMVVAQFAVFPLLQHF